MYRKDFPPIVETAEDLGTRLKQARDARVRGRLHLLFLIRSEDVRTRQEAARALAVHRNTITHWLSLYEQGGLNALLQVKRTGPKSEQKTLPPSVFEELSARVNSQGFTGYTAAQQWLYRRFGLKVAYRTVHGIIRYRLKAKLKRARPRHQKKRRRLRQLPSPPDPAA